MKQHYVARAALLAISAALVRADTYLVLPFFNESGNANLNWIGESIADTIHDAVASQGLMVISRDDREETYQRLSLKSSAGPLTLASVMRIGQSADADEVFYGHFNLKAAADPKKSRGSLSISAQILDLKHLHEGPAFTETGALEDLATLQNHVAWQALEYINPKDAPTEAEFRHRHPPIRVDAIENYMRGLLATTSDDRHRFLSQALRLEPNFSQAAFQLGRLEWRQKEFRSAAEWLRRVAPVDPNYNQANFLLGLSRYDLGDFAGAQTAFQIVAANVPLNEVINDLGAAESRRNLPAALDDFQKALEGDASDPDYHFNVGYALWKRGMFSAAAERFRSVLERDPNDRDATLLLERCLKQAGPRSGDVRTQNLERIKTTYEESAYLELKSILQKKAP